MNNILNGTLLTIKIYKQIVHFAEKGILNTKKKKEKTEKEKSTCKLVILD